MEVRQLVAEEGREARNLIAFHVSVDTPASRISRKPPRSVTGSSGATPLRRVAAGPPPRLRSASAGRDKRAELQARYWALLFGNLQRAVGEIYTTVEAHENLSECQEVILVLENYTRDFKSLCEWFRLKWEYDNTPPPQRPQSLAWEVRKTDFVRPESRRTHSVKSSPSVSGKNSPSLSGHNTPSGKNSPSLSTGKASPGSGKISPRILGTSITSPKSNIEFFSSKSSVAAKIHSKVDAKCLKDSGSRLSDIKEKVAMDSSTTLTSDGETEKKLLKTDSPNRCDLLVVEIGTAKECVSITSPKPVVIKTSPKSVKVFQKDVTKNVSPPTKVTDSFMTSSLDNSNNEIGSKDTTTSNSTSVVVQQTSTETIDINQCVTQEKNFKEDTTGNSTEIILLESNHASEVPTVDVKDIQIEIKSKAFYDNKNTSDVASCQLAIVDVVDSLKNDQKDSIEKPKENSNATQNQETISDAILKSDVFEDENSSQLEISPQVKDNAQKAEETNKDEVKSVTELKSANIRPAYSQAAAKPKSASAKNDLKSGPQKADPSSLTRSKTVAEIKQNNRPGSNRQVQTKRTSNNRCSYPFNLTTGRPSLFDGTPATNARSHVKTNINRTNPKLASGDTKSVKNEDASKKEPLKRPSDLKIFECHDNKRTSNPTSEKLNDLEKFSSTDTMVTQINRNESSESLKTLVPDPEYQLYDDLFATSIEVLNIDDSANNDNDGWLTVKSRRLSRESKKQSKSHWANRFNQPSATASLPTLNMIESPTQENKHILSKSVTKPPKVTTENTITEKTVQTELCAVTSIKKEIIEIPVANDVGSLKANEQNTENITDKMEYKDKETKPSKKMSKVNTMNLKKPENKALKVISTAIVRQKSDVTGLKTRSSRNKSIAKNNRNDKQKDRVKSKSDLTRNRLHSSLESLIPSGLSRSQESTENSFDFDRWKFEFKNSFDFLEDEDRLLNRSEFLKTADPVEMSEIAMMTSEIEENERKISLALDFQCDVDQRKLCEEEDLLNRQIQELQQVSDIDLDTETDDTETDAEILCDDVRNLDPDSCSLLASLGPLAASLEDQYEPVLAGLSWAERVDTLATLEALVARYPGRAQQLHAKLSQGIRRRGSLQETLKRYQSKQARAEHQRLELQTERTKKIQQLLARVEDVKAAKNQLIEEKRLRMEQRLQKAAENRDQHLKDIVRKAHDEEEKLREIAFIKQLEAEHRRQDFLEQCRSHTARLRQMRRDRLRKLEQKAAREAAVGARRLALEAARRLHVSGLLERRRQRDARVVELREKTRQRRDSAARQKAAEVKSRLVALAAAADADAAALRSRIRNKQDATRERHAERLQAIRTRALQPVRQQTTSESHDTKQDEEQAPEVEEPEVSKDKVKAIRKKSRKLKQKLLTAGQDFENRSKAQPITALMMKNKMCRALNQLQHILTPITANGFANGEHNGTAEEDRRKKSLSVESDCNEKKKKKRNSRRKQSEQSAEEEIKNTEGKRVEAVKSSKVNSVCSSMSDLSRQSRNEVNFASILDTNTLDRGLNELYRVLDKLDKNAPEWALFQQLQGHRVLSQILSLVASQDSASAETAHIQTKCAVTCCGAALLVARACPLAAADLLRSNAAVHAARLPLDAPESDAADGRESPLTRVLLDLLCALLESVQHASKMAALRTDANTEAVDEGTAELAERRLRAHQLISYLCVSGICAAGSAERDALYRLLGVCCELCAPLPGDHPAGGERAAAWQALRGALRGELGAARARLAELSVCASPPRAADCGRLPALLRAACERDHTVLQEAFGDGGALEFRAAAARLLAAHLPGDRDPPPAPASRLAKNQPSREQKMKEAEEREAMLLDLISVIGFFVVNNPRNQEAMCGGGGAVVRLLCGVPAGWLCVARRCRALLPTLAALAASARAADCIAADLNLQMLEDYLVSPEAQNIRLAQLVLEGRKQKPSKK